MRQQQTTQQTPDPVTEPTISMLINSICYFIDCVFILRSKKQVPTGGTTTLPGTS
jgi:hypothetical protein